RARSADRARGAELDPSELGKLGPGPLAVQLLHGDEVPGGEAERGVPPVLGAELDLERALVPAGAVQVLQGLLEHVRGRCFEPGFFGRSEERRVGKECRLRGMMYAPKKNEKSSDIERFRVQ